jgi:hypothetical protein
MEQAFFIGGPKNGETASVEKNAPAFLRFAEQCGCHVAANYPDGCGCPTVIHQYCLSFFPDIGRFEYRYFGEDVLRH